MKNARFALLVLSILTLARFSLAAAAPQPAPPELGAHLPDAITHSTTEPMRCLSAEAHFDPCAVRTLGGVRYVLAWDQSTFQLVYLFTDDPAFRTQNNLAPGLQVRMVRSRLLPFKSWQIDPRSVSGGWFPVVVPLDQPTIVGEEDETSALVIGFVRTVYLNERVLAR
jgi:hypothetical protein